MRENSHTRCHQDRAPHADALNGDRTADCDHEEMMTGPGAVADVGRPPAHKLDTLRSAVRT